MAPPAEAFAYPAAAVSPFTAGQFTATWNGTTLTDTVTAGGAVLATFAGQCYANLNTPLPGWPSGQPS
jgi:hypothetical protein